MPDNSPRRVGKTTRMINNAIQHATANHTETVYLVFKLQQQVDDINNRYGRVLPENIKVINYDKYLVLFKIPRSKVKYFIDHYVHSCD